MTNGVLMLDISQIADQRYIPTSVEIKRVLMMYLLIGVMIQLAKSQLTVFEYQHLKQSLGWFILVIIASIVTSPLRFIPYGTMVIAVIGAAALGYILYQVYRAYQGHYPEKGLLTSLGAWILTIFDHSVTVTRL